jgi:hypothetical protein
MAQKKAKQHSAYEQKIKRELEELSKCTFHPVLNSNHNKLHRPEQTSIYERYEMRKEQTER